MIAILCRRSIGTFAFFQCSPGFQIGDEAPLVEPRTITFFWPILPPICRTANYEQVTVKLTYFLKRYLLIGDSQTDLWLTLNAGRPNKEPGTRICSHIAGIAPTSDRHVREVRG